MTKRELKAITLEEYNNLIMDDAEKMLLSVLEKCRKEKREIKENANEASEF